MTDLSPLAATYPVNHAILGTVDLRDYLYTKASQGPYPFSVDLAQRTYEIEDQAQWGTCGPNAGGAIVESMFKFNQLTTDISRMHWYRKARAITGLPPNIEGVVLRDMLKAGYHTGLIQEVLWPYTQASHDDPMPPELDTIAAQLKIGRYEAILASGPWPVLELPERIAMCKDAMAQGHWLLVGGWVTESLRHLSGPWTTHMEQYELLAEGEMIGGHAFAACGYNDAGMKCLNSWGPHYGDGGFMGLPWEFLLEPGIEVWVIRKVGAVYAREPVGIREEFQNRYNYFGRIVPPVEFIGLQCGIWVVAKSPAGQWVYKPNLNINAWAPVPAGGVSAVPASAVVTMPDVQEVPVVKDWFWDGLTPFRDWEIYIGWGTPTTLTQHALVGKVAYYEPLSIAQLDSEKATFAARSASGAGKTPPATEA